MELVRQFWHRSLSAVLVFDWLAFECFRWHFTSSNVENHISYSEVPRETGGECPTSGRVHWPQWFLARLLRQLKVSLCLPENRGARLSFAKQKSVLQSLGSDLRQLIWWHTKDGQTSTVLTQFKLSKDHNMKYTNHKCIAPAPPISVSLTSLRHCRCMGPLELRPCGRA